MKKNLLFAIFIGIASYSFGQFNLGLAGGINVSKLSTDLSDYKNDAMLGYKAGAFARLGTKLHLQPEIYYSFNKAGFTYNSEDGSDITKVKHVLTFNSIDVPVLVGYKIFNPPLLNIRLNAGPVASFTTAKEIETTENNLTVTTSEKFEKSFQIVNWGFQFGGGLDFGFLVFDIRYELGLNNIYNKPDDNQIGDLSEIKKNVFFICIGFKIL
ncbi:MAG: porin family protein [Bacteroidales bacterium]